MAPPPAPGLAVVREAGGDPAAVGLELPGLLVALRPALPGLLRELGEGQLGRAVVLVRALLLGALRLGEGHAVISTASDSKGSQDCCVNP
jgi:hypothetical protein